MIAPDSKPRHSRHLPQATEIHPLGKHRNDLLGRRYPFLQIALREPKVEAGTSQQTLFVDFTLLDNCEFLGAFALAALIALPPVAQAVQFVLHARTPVGILLVADVALKILFPAGFGNHRCGNAAGIVAPDAVTAPTELELDVLVLHLDTRDHDFIAG